MATTTEIKAIETGLAKLKREVDDLHPHLQSFLGKIKDIKRVDYTHGIDELGADFVLSKLDDSINSMSYVGVIVKNDKITQSSVDDVLRQIGECKLKRYVKHGAHRVYMNEVWVIANGTISNHAKIKIHANHAIGVVFFSRKDLATLMVKYNYSLSGNLPTDVAICLSGQTALAKELQSESFGVGIAGQNSVVMNQVVIKREPAQYATRKTKRPRLSKKMSIRNAMEDNAFLVVEGDPGCGKSTMLHNILEEHASEKKFKETNMIPIFVACQELLEKHEKKISNLTSWFESAHNVSSRAGNFYYLVIIDGIDECAMDRDERIQAIKQWKSEAKDANVKKMVFASRDYFEEKYLSVPTYRIADVTMSDVISLIKKSLADMNTVNRIITDVVRSDIFRSLPRSPLATTILISLLRDQKDSQELPSNLTELFSKYTERALGRWKKSAEEGATQRRYKATDRILSLTATYMLDNHLAQLNEDETKKIFQDYLNERKLEIDADELFSNAVENSNLVYLHDGVFRFRHRTIAEFFYSKTFSSARIDEIGENVFDVRWAAILFFHVGAENDCPDLLEKINSIKPRHESGKIMKAINMANILLAGYATPYTCITKILRSIFVDTSQYLEEVFHQRSENSALSNISVMHALLFFRLMMDYEYSRPFFKPAIEESLLEIEGSSIDNNVKATSLFLLNLAYAGQGGEDIFSGMVKKLGRDIPVHIQLAINHETDVMKYVNNDMKKYKKIVKRTLLSVPSSSTTGGGRVNDLYNKEIRYLPKPKK